VARYRKEEKKHFQDLVGSNIFHVKADEGYENIVRSLRAWLLGVSEFKT